MYMENHVLSKLQHNVHVAQMKRHLENLEWFRNISYMKIHVPSMLAIDVDKHIS